MTEPVQPRWKVRPTGETKPHYLYVFASPEGVRWRVYCPYADMGENRPCHAEEENPDRPIAPPGEEPEYKLRRFDEYGRIDSASALNGKYDWWDLNKKCRVPADDPWRLFYRDMDEYDDNGWLPVNSCWLEEHANNSDMSFGELWAPHMEQTKIVSPMHVAWRNAGHFDEPIPEFLPWEQAPEGQPSLMDDGTLPEMEAENVILATRQQIMLESFIKDSLR